MTESNTGSDAGPNTPHPVPIRDRKNKQTRLMAARETPRERMLRVVLNVQKQRKKRK